MHMIAFRTKSVRTRLVLAISVLIVPLVCVTSYEMIGTTRDSLATVAAEVATQVDRVRLDQKETIERLVNEQVTLAKDRITDKADALADVVANVT